MHPAVSVIVFTTASGAGYGLLAMLGLMAPAGLLPASRWFGLAGLGLALGLITLGLLASTFHLGHAERAWRAFTQWRSSWLSREGVMALVTYLPAGLFGLGWVGFERSGGAWGGLGVLAAALAGITVGCTAMIYRSLKPVHQWHNGFVLPVYLLLGLATGALWLAALLGLWGASHSDAALIALIGLVPAWVLKTAYWRFIDTTAGLATPNTATGLRHGRVRLLDPPHSDDNYLLKEMGFRIGRKHAARLRRLTHLSLFVVPLALTAVALASAGAAGSTAAVLAALSASLGVMIERWLFFAQAKHTVTLYYGADAA